MPIPETESEVLTYLPEIDGIRGDLRDVALEFFTEHVPDYFWVIRASERHHPEDHRGQHGLVLHVKRSFNAWLRIERMLKQLDYIDSVDANIGRAAVLMHDGFMYGKDSWREEGVCYHGYVETEVMPSVIGVPKYGDDEHGSICADHVDEYFDVPESLLHCIRTHNGGFGQEPNPDSMLAIGHHLADAFGSDKQCLYRVYDPTGVFDDYTVSPSMSMDADDSTMTTNEL